MDEGAFSLGLVSGMQKVNRDHNQFPIVKGLSIH